MVEIDLPLIIGLLGTGALAAYVLMKYRLAQVIEYAEAMLSVMKLYQEVLEDDKVTESEARALWDAIKGVYNKFRALFPAKA